MRHTGLPALLILVSACTSPPRELSAATDTERLDSNSIETSRSSIDPGDPSQGPAGAQESTALLGPSLFTLEASVPLVSWNSEERRYELQLVDPATGQGVPDREPIEIKKGSTYARTIIVSADGTRLVAVTGVGSACEAYASYHACWPIVDSWDVLPGRRLDGRPVVLLASWTGESPTAPTRFSMLDLEPFEVVTPWSVSGEAFWATTP